MEPQECKTATDIRLWLESELEKGIQHPPHPVTIPGETAAWQFYAGFRRSFCSHSVFHAPETGHYAFHVEEYPDYDHFPNMGSYLSYEDLLQGVANRYALLWGLESL